MIYMEKNTETLKLSKKTFLMIFFVSLITLSYILDHAGIGVKRNATIDMVYLKASDNRKYLGEFIRGEDNIIISGHLAVVEDGEEIPLGNVRVYLYMNISHTSYLLMENLTDENGNFYFEIHVDETYPTGEVNFTVVYPGSIRSGLAPTKFYYYAVIKEPQQGTDSASAWAVVGALITVFMVGSILSIKSIYRGRKHAGEIPMWREILNSMLEQAKRRDINFVLLIRELIDSLCKKYGIIPKFGSPLQQKILFLKDSISDGVFNVLKNLISLYELINYGGPYARTVLISTMDFGTWCKLLDMVSRELEGRK